METVLAGGVVVAFFVAIYALIMWLMKHQTR